MPLEVKHPKTFHLLSLSWKDSRTSQSCLGAITCHFFDLLTAMSGLT